MICLNCGKAGAYIRTRTKDVYCRLCGHAEPLAARDVDEEAKEKKLPKNPLDNSGAQE